MKRGLIVVSIMITFIFGGPIEFSGNASIYTEYNPVTGAPQERPTSKLRFNLNPSLNIYGMPLSLNLLISSEESSLCQALNKFRIFLQPKNLAREMIHAPGFIFSIAGIEIGTCYPYYSPLTLSGIPVTGGAIEMNPWILYLAATAGRIQRGVEGSDTTDAAYERRLYSGKFGIGKKEGSHVFFTILYAGDDTSSIPSYSLPLPGDTDTVVVVIPQENYCVGVDFDLSLIEDHFKIESEIVGSQFTRDMRMPELVVPGAPSWITDIFNPRMSSAFDYAFSVKPSLSILSTNLWGSVNMVGPGFISLGAPNLRNDNLSFEMGLNQNLFNNALNLSAFHKREHDNLIGNKLSTTYFLSYVFAFGLNFFNVPYLQASYTPFHQKNDSIDLDSKTDIFSLNTGYNFILFGLNHSPNFSWSHQKQKDVSVTNNYTSNSFYINETIGFTFPLSISTGIGITHTDYAYTKDRIFSLDIRTSYTFFQSCTNGIGFNLSTEGEKGSRYGINFNSSIPIWLFGNMSVSAERNIYHGEHQDEDYNEWRIIGTITKTW